MYKRQRRGLPLTTYSAEALAAVEGDFTPSAFVRGITGAVSYTHLALALEWLVKHRDGLEKKVYQVPAEIDDAIGRVKLAAMGLSIDALTPEQEEYLNGWKA